MPSLFRKLDDWVSAKLGLPSDRELRAYCRAWDFAQTNSQALVRDDPDKEEIGEAWRLFQVNPKRGFAEMLSLAERGSAWSMDFVAWCYECGEGVDCDLGQTEAWSRRAFEAGSDRAQLVYAWIVSNRGDIEGAKAIYHVGADRDWAPALHWLAMCLIVTAKTPEDLRAARIMLERAVELGSPGAKWNLYRRMARGQFGIGEAAKGLRLLWKFFAADLEELQTKRKVETPHGGGLADMPVAGNA